MDPVVENISKQTEVPVSDIPQTPPAPRKSHKTSFVLMLLFVLFVIGAFFAGTYYQGMNANKEEAKIAAISPTPAVASPTPDPTTDWKSQNIGLYNLSLNLPPDWTLSELKRRPEPTGPQDSKTGHDCAEYEVKDAQSLIVLSIKPLCGYSDGGGTKVPHDAVTVANLPNDESIVRIYDTSLAQYIYATAGTVTFSDSSGTREELWHSNILTIGKDNKSVIVDAKLSLKGTDAQKQQDLEIVDKIIASLKES